MEEDNSSNHAEDVAEADHGIGHAEGEFLEDVHPQDRPSGVAYAAEEELPVDQEPSEKGPGPFERPHPLEGIFQEDLTSAKEKALSNGKVNQLPHNYLVLSAPNTFREIFIR